MQAAAAVNTDALEGYWKLDETAGTSVADVSGHSNDGTRTNGAISSDVPTSDFPNTRSIDFDGSGDYIDMGDAANLEVEDGSFTISVWHKPASIPSAGETHSLVSKGAPGEGGYSLQYENVEGTYYINLSKFGVADQRVAISSLNTNNWYHIVAVQRGSEVEYYIDGTSQGTYSDASAYNTSATSSFRIGGTNTSGTFGTLYADGLIDDVRVYSHELSSTEITSLSNGFHTYANWLGFFSSDTEIAANWSINAVPDPYTRIVITDTTTQPVATTEWSLANLTINSGAQLGLGSYDLTMNDSGTYSNEGTLRLDNTQTITGITNDTDSGTVLVTPGGHTTGLAMGADYNDLIINDGLVAYWQFDDTSGTSVSDASGYENNSTRVNATSSTIQTAPTSFVNNRALEFDGDGDHVTIPDSPSLDLTGDMTIAVWLYLNIQGSHNSILDKLNYGSNDGYSLKAENTGSVSEGLTMCVGNQCVFSNDNVLTSETWQQVVVTFDTSADTVTFYVNGTTAGTATVTNDLNTNTKNVFIGAEGAVSGYFDGILDDLRVYDRVLSVGEISSLADGDQPATSETTLTIDETLDINGDLVLNAGTMDATTNDILVAGDFENNGGIFNAGTGTVTLDGADQTINSANTFYNLTKSVSAANALIFGERATTTISNTLTLNGASGNLLSLRSSATGTAFKLDPQGTRNISYVDVQDSNNTNDTVIAYLSSNTYGSNLTNWQTSNPDTTDPTADTLSPADNATNSATSTDLVITLSEAVDAVSGNVTIKKTSDDSTVETFDVTADISGSGSDTITINPASDLDYSTTYYVLIDATAFDDAAGNSYAGISTSTAWNFTTASNPDVSDPSVSSLAPADDATDVATTSDLTVTFSEAVDAESGNVTIKKTSDDSTVETFDVTADISGSGSTTITINPNANLDYDTGYYVLIDATAFDDAAGNSYAGIATSTSWNFTTKSEPVEEDNNSGGGGGSGGGRGYSLYEEIDRRIDRGDEDSAEQLIVREVIDEFSYRKPNIYKITKLLKIYLELNPVAESNTQQEEDSPEVGTDTHAAFFPYDLRRGMTDRYVKSLQTYLNEQGFLLARSGAGAPGEETEYFGSRTHDALGRYQEAHAEEILEPLGLEQGTGYFGDSTRRFVNMMLSRY
jgi:methionine-rich copper-binding protein CopC